MVSLRTAKRKLAILTIDQKREIVHYTIGIMKFFIDSND